MIFNQLPGTVFSSKCEIINMHDKNIYIYPNGIAYNKE